MLGMAMRLGQRLSGGVGAVLKRSALEIEDGTPYLAVRPTERTLAGDAVKRWLGRLAEALELKPEIVAGG